MDKINWKQKLTSRKLWLALVGFMTGLLLYLGMQEEEVEKLAALLMSFGSLLAYIIAEGLVDANRIPEEPDHPPDAE